jgi:hypothetical protein
MSDEHGGALLDRLVDSAQGRSRTGLVSVNTVESDYGYAVMLRDQLPTWVTDSEEGVEFKVHEGAVIACGFGATMTDAVNAAHCALKANG